MFFDLLAEFDDFQSFFQCVKCSSPTRRVESSLESSQLGTRLDSRLDSKISSLNIEDSTRTRLETRRVESSRTRLGPSSTLNIAERPGQDSDTYCRIGLLK